MSALFNELAATWLSTVATVTLKPSGFKSYESMIRNHLLPAYGDMPVDMITAAGLQAYVAGKVAGGLSERTVANHVQVMRRLMSFAADTDVIESNPIMSVVPPRQEPAAARIRYLTPEQLTQLIEATSPAWRVLVAMACLTGLRKGEQLALRFADIDSDRHTISVNKTIRDGVVTSPKTPWSIGAIPLPESLVPLLEERRRRVPDPDGLVFSRKDGTPLPSHVPNAVLTKALEAAGLPSVTWHEMSRHSWVVAHLQAGTDIPTLTRLGRWKTADVLLSTYAHVLPSAGGDAVKRLDDLMSLDR